MSEDVSEYEVYFILVLIIIGMRIVVLLVKRGNSRCGIRSLNRVVKICENYGADGKRN